MYRNTAPHFASLLMLLFASLQAFCQSSTLEKSYYKPHFEAYVGVNFNFTPSNTIPLDFLAFYNT